MLTVDIKVTSTTHNIIVFALHALVGGGIYKHEVFAPS